MSSGSMQLGHEAITSLSLSFIKSQFLTCPHRAPHTIDLTREVAIINAITPHYGCQSVEKGESVAKTLRADHPSAKIEVWSLEMSSYSSIQAFCHNVDKDLPRLDITILNAGLLQASFGTCSTGHERVIQVNYLSTFLFAILMLPISKAKAPTGKPGRLIVVSSGTALFAKFPYRHHRPLLKSFDDSNTTPWDSQERYFSSKMLGHLFFVRMLEYLNDDDVIVNLVEPGMCKGSELHRDAKGSTTGVLLSIFKTLTGRRPEDGAWMYVDAAVVKGKESHGCFIMDWKIHPFTKLVYLLEGNAIMDALWDETMAEFEPAGAREILENSKKRQRGS